MSNGRRHAIDSPFVNVSIVELTLHLFDTFICILIVVIITIQTCHISSPVTGIHLIEREACRMPLVDAIPAIVDNWVN